MPFPVYPTTEYVIRLAALIAAEYPTALGDETVLKLFKNNVTPDANAGLGLFEEADFAGYGEVKLVMSTPSLNDQGIVTSRSNLCNFPVAAGVDPQTIYGVYIGDVLGNLVAAQRFETPQTVGGVLPTAISGLWRTSEPLSSYGWIDVEA